MIEDRKTQLSDTLDVKQYFEPHEFVWGVTKVVKGKGRPIFFWKENVKGYVDSKTLLAYNKDHGLRKKRPINFKKPPEPIQKLEGTKKQRGNVLSRIVARRNKSSRTAANKKGPDHYPTPPEASQAILNFLDLPKSTKFWEPCCGRGHISQTMKLNGWTNVVSSDLYNYGYGNEGVDFLVHRYDKYDWIITNPPFNLSEEFIIRAFKYGKPFAFLLKQGYWNSIRRRELFVATKPTHVLPLTFRPDFSFTHSKPTMECQWTVWGPESFHNTNMLDEDFKTDFFPLKKPNHCPQLDFEGNLLKPFYPFHHD